MVVVGVSSVVGAAVGAVAGYAGGVVDETVGRGMDVLMAFPGLLLAIALVAALGAQLWTVVVAIAIPEIPRVTRLVRSLVLTLREENFVAITSNVFAVMGLVSLYFALKNDHAGVVTGPYNAEKWISPAPSPGDLILFPSYLVHSVRLYHGERPRICVPFNAHVRRSGA